jgi:hypothetical protein
MGEEAVDCNIHLTQYLAKDTANAVCVAMRDVLVRLVPYCAVKTTKQGESLLESPDQETSEAEENAQPKYQSAYSAPQFRATQGRNTSHH